MKNRNILLSVVFTLGGGLMGLLWYRIFGCDGGNCIITSSPLVTILYVGIIGWLVGGLFQKNA